MPSRVSWLAWHEKDATTSWEVFSKQENDLIKLGKPYCARKFFEN
jgi:hypothetical protein